jgi:hypothetical protein
MVAFCSSDVKQQISDVYSGQPGFVLPSSRNVGGVNIGEVETDFCKMGVAWNRFVPAGTLVLVDVAHVNPVILRHPQKGSFYLEQLAKTGASESHQIFGGAGLDHGLEFMHGKITGIAES